MSADKHFVIEQHSLLPDTDELKQLKGWNLKQLREWCGLHGVRPGHVCKDDLVRIVFMCQKLKLPLNPTEIETTKEAAARLVQLLQQCGGIPDPTTIKEKDWSDDLTLLPDVSYADIYNYLIDRPGLNAESLKAYKGLEAYNYTINGWVQDLKMYCSGTSTVVKAAVKPSQHSGSPFEAWVIVKHDGSIQAGRCECTSGLGEVCSHVGATLFKAMAAALLGFNKPESCTSKACEWNNTFVKKVLPERLDRIIFRKPRLNQTWKRSLPTRKYSSSSGSSSDDEALFKILSEAAPDAVGLHLLDQETESLSDKQTIADVASEVTLELEKGDHSDNYHSNPEDHGKQTPQFTIGVRDILLTAASTKDTDLFTALRQSITEADSEHLYSVTKTQAADPLWVKARQDRITASKMGEVHFFMKSKRLEPSKTLMSTTVGPQRDLSRVPAIIWGNDHEQDALTLYMEKRTVRCKDFVLRRSGLKIPTGDAHIGATPDGHAQCSCCPERILEVKCPAKSGKLYRTPKQGAKEGLISFVDKKGSLKREHKYFIQVQGQMAVMGIHLCDFVIWSGGKISVESIQFEEALWMSVKQSIDSFYIKYVLPKVIPEQQPKQNSAKRQRRK